MRHDLATGYRSLAASPLNAFSQAEEGGVAGMNGLGPLPWLVEEYEQTVASMGVDDGPHGVDANRTTVEAASRYAEQQGLTARNHGISARLIPWSLADQNRTGEQLAAPVQ